MMTSSSINTNRFVSVICIICFITSITACTRKGTEGISDHHIINKTVNGYELVFYNNDGNQIFNKSYQKSPFVREINNQLYQVVNSSGSNSNDTYFVDVKEGKVSDSYFNLLFSDDEIAVFMEDSTIFVSEIFDKNKKYVEIKRDFSLTAVQQSTILSVERDGDVLCIRYLKGRNYEEVYEEIAFNA